MMTLMLRRSCCLWALLFCWLPTLSAQVVQNIEIRHVGPASASDDFIKAHIKVKAGDTYSRTGVDDDVRALISTGLFHNVQVGEERTPQGVKVIYVVQGKPILTDVRFEGNKKYSSKKLLKKITSKIGEPLEEYKLFSDAREIEKMYQKSGYQKTEVKYEPPQIDERAGRATVSFTVKESSKIKIENVEFAGTQAFSQKKLRKAIKTRRHWFFSWLTGSGVLKDEQFEEDKEKLADFYRNEGYIDFEIKDVQFNYIDPKHLKIRFVVSEGTQYRVGSVDFSGNTLFNREQILQGDRAKGVKSVKMVGGEVFRPKGLTEDVESIRDFYGSRGYIDVWVRPIKNPNTTTGTMDLVYEIHDEEKGQSFIEKVEIRGNTKTKDRVIRRELAVAPGEVFDMVRVKRSKGRLEQMSYFDKVETQAEPTTIANRKDLVIDVEEASTGNVEMGAGFSSVDNLVGFVGFREGNFDLFNPPYFRGGGQKFRISVQMGTRRKDFQITFIEPWFLGRRLAFETDLYHRDLRFYSQLYDVRQTGARLSLTKALGSEFLIGRVSYTIENIALDNIDDSAPKIIRDEPSNRLVSTIGASIAWDTRNSIQLPSRGQRTELSTEVAGPFGGETDFYKFELNSSWYFPGIFEGHVLEAHGRGGIVENYGDTERVPLFDRFFLGGVTSLRGYRYRDVGPHVDDEPIGGETYWYGSLEYSVPIIERLRFALFYDIGNVYEDAFSFSRSAGQKFYNDNWGVGVRLNIPRLGPLRLDYGIPITHDESTSGSGRFQFSVGYSRDY
jgi:outer membrane protein insertion porin family